MISAEELDNIIKGKVVEINKPRGLDGVDIIALLVEEFGKKKEHKSTEK